MSGRVHLPKMEPPVEPPEQVRARAMQRVNLIGAALLMLLLGTGARGVQLSMSPSDRTLRAASVQRWNEVQVSARRGEILDRNGRRLATSVATPNIIVDPLRVAPEEVAELSRQVAEILEINPSEIAEKMRRDTRYAKLASRVHPATAAKIEALDHPALWSERNARRFYPEESLAAQLVGFVDGAGAGREGMESTLDTWLRGENLVLQRRRDRRGLAVDDPASWSRDVNVGMNVHTTIDRTIQRIAESALEKIVETSAPISASALVIDVKTGDILALANVPTFNPNNLATEAAPRKNHVIQDAIEPGSVLKPFTVAAAVEDGMVQSDTLIDCEGGSYFIGRTRIKDDHPHGTITISDVIKYSSNIGSAKLALRMGGERFIQYMKDFGFGQRTGVALPGERSGVLRKPETIRPIELATTAFGQGMTATGLQLALATGTIANGGVRMKPRLVTRIEDQYGVPEYLQKPTVAARVVSAETAHSVAAMMQTVTDDGGTARRARVPGYLVAGKTGTAEKVKDGVYSDARIGSFVGFIPADDPVLAIVVSVDEPTKGSRYGGIVAAPAFAEIAGLTLRYLGVQPNPELLGTPPASQDDEPEDGTEEIDGDDALALDWEGDGWLLPELEGHTLREAMVALQGAGLDVRLSGSGTVVAMEPASGTRVREGSVVHLTLE